MLSFQSLVAKLEDDVTRHTSFQDDLNQLTSWLRVAFEKLSTYRDASGDDVTIQNKLERLAVLRASLGEGDALMERVTHLHQHLLPIIPASGHAKLDSDVSGAMEELKRLKSELDSSRDMLEQQLQRWKDFESGRSALNSALTQQQTALRNEAEAVCDLQDAEQQLTHTRTAQDQLTALRDQLNDVTNTGQNLLEVNSDARVTQALAQLTCSYQTLERGLSERARNLQEACTELSRLEKGVEEVEEWLESKRQVLLPTSQEADDGRSRAQLEAQLQSVRVCSFAIHQYLLAEV